MVRSATSACLLTHQEWICSLGTTLSFQREATGPTARSRAGHSATSDCTDDPSPTRCPRAQGLCLQPQRLRRQAQRGPVHAVALFGLFQQSKNTKAFDDFKKSSKGAGTPAGTSPTHSLLI